MQMEGAIIGATSMRKLRIVTTLLTSDNVDQVVVLFILSRTLSEVCNVVTILGFLLEVAQIIAPSICLLGNVILLHLFARAPAGE